MDLAKSEFCKIFIRLMQPLGVEIMLNILIASYAFIKNSSGEVKFRILKSHVRIMLIQSMQPLGVECGYDHKTCLEKIKCDNLIVPDTSLFG